MYLTHSRTNNHRTELTTEVLRNEAPSLFAEQAKEGVSARYTFLPSIKIVESLRQAGWAPVEVQEQRVRLEGRKGFQKHLVRFQRRDIVAKVNDFAPEITLINSHDAKSAYQIHASLFRFVCANGLMVSDSEFAHMSIRHSGQELGEVLGASFLMLDKLPELTSRVNEFKSRRLSPAESLEFAKSALTLRYDDAESAPVGPEKLLRVHRREDNGNDLWSVFNTVQENLLRGGLKDYSRHKTNGDWYPRTRAVTGLDEGVRLNKSLWQLAEQYKVQAAN